VSGFLRDQLEVAFSEEEILEACAILDTNAFEMRRGRIKFRGLFPLVSMMAHDCVPNTKHAFDGKDAILLFATVDIAKGAALTATYTQPLWNTMARRAHMRAAKCFDCACQRCADPQEMGTFLSAIKCTNCATGICQNQIAKCLIRKWF
jgi:SET domain